MFNSVSRFFSRETSEKLLFIKRLQSLPLDERKAFWNHSHPCQDKYYDGIMAARSAAQALQAEIGHFKEVKRVEMAADSDGCQLEVVIKSDVHPEWQPGFQPIYRGFKVYRRPENENQPN